MVDGVCVCVCVCMCVCACGEAFFQMLSEARELRRDWLLRLRRDCIFGVTFSMNGARYHQKLHGETAQECHSAVHVDLTHAHFEYCAFTWQFV